MAESHSDYILPLTLINTETIIVTRNLSIAIRADTSVV